MMLAAHNLSIAAKGKLILQDVHFTAMEPGWVEITGDRVSGKSTFLNAVYGFPYELQGQLEVLGHDIQTLTAKSRSELRRKMGFCFQCPRLIEDKTVRANASLAWRAANLYKDEAMDKRLLAVASLFKMEHKLKEAIYQLSYTEKHLAALIQSMICRPSILILDQVFDCFDAQATNELIMSLDEIQRLEQICIVVATKELSTYLPSKRSIFKCAKGTLVPFGS